MQKDNICLPNGRCLIYMSRKKLIIIQKNNLNLIDKHIANHYNEISRLKGGEYIMKRTYQPNKHKRKKTHGFFARKFSLGNVLNKRMAKGRKKLSA